MSGRRTQTARTKPRQKLATRRVYLPSRKRPPTTRVESDPKPPATLFDPDDYDVHLGRL